MSKTKVCSVCRIIKNLNDFPSDKSRRDNLSYICKNCKNKNKRIYRAENKCKISKQRKEYRKKNLEVMRIKDREYYQKNKKIVKELSRKRYRKNRQKESIRGKVYRKKNREKINKRQKNRRDNDIQFRLRQNISSIILQKLKRRLSNKKYQSSFNYLPYIIEELMQHLEKQFEPWMNWSNYGRGNGKWSIDHILPDSSFNYKSMEDKEFQECWALKNLQPLEFIENIKKSNKIL